VSQGVNCKWAQRSFVAPKSLISGNLTDKLRGSALSS